MVGTSDRIDRRPQMRWEYSIGSLALGVQRAPSLLLHCAQSVGYEACRGYRASGLTGGAGL